MSTLRAISRIGSIGIAIAAVALACSDGPSTADQSADPSTNVDGVLDGAAPTADATTASDGAATDAGASVQDATIPDSTSSDGASDAPDDAALDGAVDAPLAADGGDGGLTWTSLGVPARAKITGIVREAGSGTALQGATVSGCLPAEDQNLYLKGVVSDAQGKFECWTQVGHAWLHVAKYDATTNLLSHVTVQRGLALTHEGVDVQLELAPLGPLVAADSNTNKLTVGDAEITYDAAFGSGYAVWLTGSQLDAWPVEPLLFDPNDVPYRPLGLLHVEGSLEYGPAKVTVPVPAGATAANVRLFDFAPGERGERLYARTPISVANGKATFDVDHFSDKALGIAEPLPFWLVTRWPQAASARTLAGATIAGVTVGTALLSPVEVTSFGRGTPPVVLQDYTGNVISLIVGTFRLTVVNDVPTVVCASPNCAAVGNVAFVKPKGMNMVFRSRPVVMGVRGSVGEIQEEECETQPGRIVMEAELSAGVADFGEGGSVEEIFAPFRSRTCIGCDTGEPCCGADAASGKSCCGDRVCSNTEACLTCGDRKVCNEPGAICCPYSATGTCPANQECKSCAPSGCAPPNTPCCPGGVDGLCATGQLCLQCTGSWKCYAPNTDCNTFTGGNGEPCTNGFSCDSASLTCCRGTGGPCSDIIDSQSNTRPVAQPTCEPCGNANQPCCGSSCNGTHVFCTGFTSGGVSFTPYCIEYGKMGQRCLAEGATKPGGTEKAWSCDEGVPNPNDGWGCICGTCGGLNEMCCAGGAFSNWTQSGPWCKAGSVQIIPGEPGFADICMCQ